MLDINPNIFGKIQHTQVYVQVHIAIQRQVQYMVRKVHVINTSYTNTSLL